MRGAACLSQLPRNPSAKDTRRFPPAARRALFALAFALCAFLLVAGFPNRAFADSFEVSKVDITAEVLTDGSLHVVESRTFELDSDCTALYWPLDGFSGAAELQVSGVRLTTPQTAGGGEEPIDLSSTPFQLVWREGEEPDESAYSVDATRNTVYVFFEELNETGETLTVTLDYTVENEVLAYKDVAELEWVYVSDWWEESSADVSLTITLPVPQDGQVVSGDTVHAWGHGPSDGTVSVNEDGTISYQTSLVRSGQYAEAHIVFPVSWLSNLPNDDEVQSNRNESRLDSALSEEETWSDQDTLQRMADLGFVIACGVACVLLLVWALCAYRRHGREHAPDFTDDYWRDVPDPSVPPAAIGRLWRWNHESPDDFVATVLHLASEGALLVEGQPVGSGGAVPSKCLSDAESEKPVKEADSGGAGTVSAFSNDYCLTLRPAMVDAVTEPIDRAALDLLFRNVAKEGGQLRLGDIGAYGKKHPREFAAAMGAWQKVVSTEVDKQDFFDAKSTRVQKRLAVAAVLLLLLPGAGGLFLLHHSIQLAFVVPTALALGVVANYLPRRTVRGNNLAARCKALRNWLCDLPSLDEEPPADAKTREGLMAYAFLFGVATSPFVSRLQAVLADAAASAATSEEAQNATTETAETAKTSETADGASSAAERDAAASQDTAQ